MAKAANPVRPRFEESDFDDAGEYPQYLYIAGAPNLPPVEFKVEEVAENATPEEMIRAALDERTVETELHGDNSFGPVVIPAEKTLFGYKYALSDSGHNIRFSHKTYHLFDASIVSACGMDASGNPTLSAFNPKMADYTFYAPLRRNLAILRNYLMGHYPPTGSKINQATLKAMGEKLGEALKGKAQKLTLMERILWAIRRFIMKTAHQPISNRFLALAGVPDRGIAFMYHFLWQAQAAPEFGRVLASSQPPKDWKLAALEETPFSAENMAHHSDASRMGLIASAFELVTRNLKSVDDMMPKDKEISVDHARDILKNLRIILSGTLEEKQFDSMDTRCREAQSMLNAALAYQGALAHIARDDPDLLNDPLIMEASKSITKMGSRVKGEKESMQKQEQRAETTTQPPQPTSSKKSSKSSSDKKRRSQDSMQKLIFKFEEGMGRASEARRASRERSKQRSVSMEKVMSKETSVLPKSFKEGQSTMANPKIHQVSLHDADLIEAVKKANEDRVLEQSKATPGGKSLGGGGGK